MDGKFLLQGQMPVNKAQINSLDLLIDLDINQSKTDLLLINLDQFPSCSIYADYSIRGKNCKEGTALQGNDLENTMV